MPGHLTESALVHCKAKHVVESDLLIMRPITYQICNLSLDDLLILPLNRSVLEGDGVAWVGGANRRHTLLAPSIQRLHDVGPVICEGRDQARQVLLTTQAFVALAAQLLVDATGHRKGFVSHLTPRLSSHSLPLSTHLTT